mgnify:CR=1 FL=1
MTTDTLDLPPIIGDEPTAAAVAPVSTSSEVSTAPKVTVRDAALQPLNALEPGLRAVTERYRAVAFDLKTPKGLQAAKDARHDLRKNGRFLVQNTRDELKGLLNDAKTAVEAKAVELIAITQPREDELDKDIEAREAEVKAEKAEAARVAAERAQKQADGVAGIRGYLTRAQTTADMTAERVGKGIALLEAMTFSADEWLDPVAAANAQCETLEGMRALQATLKAREEAAAAAEAQRRENERVAAELAAAQAKLHAEQQRIAKLQAMVAEIRAAATGHDNASAADLYEARVAVAALDVSEAVYAEFAALAQAAQASTLAALDKLHGAACDREIAAVEAARATEAEAARQAATESTEGQDSQQVLKAEGASPDATDRDAPADTSPRVGAMGAGQAADEAPAAEPLPAPVARAMAAVFDACVPMPAPTLTLGKLNEWLAPLKIDAAGLEALGFPVAARVKGAMLYHDTDRAAMVAAMVTHLQGL